MQHDSNPVSEVVDGVVDALAVAATNKLESLEWRLESALILVGIGVASFILLLLLTASWWLGRALRRGIEAFDERILGVQIEIGSFDIQVCAGKINLVDVKVLNPEGKGYKDKYMLQAQRIYINLGMRRFLWTGARAIYIQSVVVEGVRGIFEKNSLRSSNVGDVLGHLKSKAEKKPDNTTHDAESQHVSATTSPANAVQGTQEAGRQIVLKRLQVKDFSMRFQFAAMGAQVSGFEMHLADIVEADFNGSGGAGLHFVVREVLMSILKSIIANVAGKDMAQYMDKGRPAQ